MKWDDTLPAHNAFASHLPKSLAWVASVYCDARPWKILAGKDATGEKGVAPWDRGDDEIDVLLKYNAADAKLTALAWQRMQADLESERHVYECDKRIALLCQHMTQTGIGFDVAKRDELSKKLRARKRGLLGEMRKLVGKRNWHPARLRDLRHALFEKFKAPMLRPTPTGLAGTSNLSLEEIRKLDTRAAKLADLALRWRASGKMLGTYVDSTIIGDDGRIHPPWKMGTVTGRLVARVMTLPRYGLDLEDQIRAMYVADGPPGKARLVMQVHDSALVEIGGQFVYYDLKQAEARLAGYFSGDDELIAACKGDIHLANALIVFRGTPAEELIHRGNEPSPHLDKHGKPLQWKAVSKKLGGCKEYRDVAKNAGFAVWYCGSADIVFGTLARLGFEVTMPGCEEMVRRFHAVYKAYYRYAEENLIYCNTHGHLRTVLLGRIRWLGWHTKLQDVSNYPIQTGIADLQNEKLPRIEDKLPKCSTVQDVKDVIEEEWGKEVTVPHNGIKFVMPIDLKVGERLSDFG